ncbi:MAG TPA: glutathionylspermidine synthase family protein [Edaphobacter sp.]|nr:glutathionylspermidine synthase family protein [Edaphobacter sp.]
MQRRSITPRQNWQQTVESQGLTFHTLENGTTYWDESAAYEFTAAEIDTLEATGNKLQEMCLAAAQHIIDEQRYAELDIPQFAIEAIEWAWNNEPPALYGRFDISWAGAQSGVAPKLLEYNADTPTSLLEAAIIQWNWLEAMPRTLVSSRPDQFNSIHEKLIAKWQDIDPYLSKPIYFAAIANATNPEDQLTVTYLRDTAQQAGLDTRQISMHEIGWNDQQQSFMDLDDHPMFSIFKLYPWEAMLNEEFGRPALDTYTAVRWIEPIWKMLLSNKGILPILWQLYPNHELLLESHFAEDPAASSLTNYIRKPLLSREGANITLVRDNAAVVSTEGPYNGRQIVQEISPQAVFNNRHSVLGLWMVDQDCCGMGIRESFSPITGNLSSFVPHFFI